MRAMHKPINQYLKRDFPGMDLRYCPICGHFKETGHDYGDIDTPPINVQMDDIRQVGYVRPWQARRCYCEKCQYMWDFVTKH